jgi:uncharacterized protein YukE
MSDIAVQPGELRASAGVARSIGEDYGPPCRTAVNAASGAAEVFVGWSIAGGLRQLADGWGPALTTLQKRLDDTATNLESTAREYEQTENTIAGALQKQGLR